MVEALLHSALHYHRPGRGARGRGGGGGGVEGRGRGTEDRPKLTRQVLGVGTVAFLLTLSYMLSRTPPLF